MSVVIPRHAALQCGIVDEDTAHPYFVALPVIDLRQVLRLADAAPAQESHDQTVLRVLSQRHSQLWKDVAINPPWQAIAIRDSKSSTNRDTMIDVVFAFHHALSDGLGGLVFHYNLLQALQEVDGAQSLSTILQVFTT